MRARKRFRKYGSFGGDAAQTVDEQSNKREAFDINELCRAGYIGEGQKNCWVHRASSVALAFSRRIGTRVFASAIGKAGYRVSQGKDISAWCLWRTCFNPTALARLPEPDW